MTARVEVEQAVTSVAGDGKLVVVDSVPAEIVYRGTLNRATVYPTPTGSVTLTQPLTVRQGKIGPASAAGDVWVDEGSYDVRVGGVLAAHFEAARGAAAYTVTPTVPGAPETFDVTSIPGLVGYIDWDRIDYATPVYDTFARANVTTGLGTSPTGQSWTNTFAAVGIQAGAAYNPTVGTLAGASMDSGMSDAVYEWLIDLHPTDGFVQCTLRLVSSGDYIWLEMRKRVDTDYLSLNKRVASVNSQIETAFQTAGTGLTLGGQHRVKVVARGPAYLVYIDDAQKFTVSVTDSTSSHLTHTRMGINFPAADLGSTCMAMNATVLRPADAAPIQVAAELAGADHAKQLTAANRPVFKDTAMNGHACARFANTTEFLTTTIPGDLKPGTIMAAVNHTANTDQDTIIATNTNGGMTLRIQSNGHLELVVTNVANVGQSRGIVPLGRWCIVAATYEPDGTAAFYIDGDPSGTATGDIAVTPGVFVYVGGRSGGGESFNGDIGPIALWNRALRGDELKAAHEAWGARYGLRINPRLTQPTVPVRLDRRLRGSNLHPSSTHSSNSSANNRPIWTDVWGPSYDATWMTSSVDAAYNAGANAFRCIGDVYGPTPTTGLVTQATYLSRYAALIDYCASKDMLVLVSGGDFRHFGTGIPFSEIKTLLVALGQLAATKQNVFAYELLQEVNTGYFGSEETLTEGVLFEFCADVARAVRAAAPNLPLGFSDIGTSHGETAAIRSRLGDIERFRRLDACVDYHDVHIYPPNTLADYALTPLLECSNKPLLVGEYGTFRPTTTAPEREQFYEDMATMVAANPNCIGAFQWAAKKTDWGFVNDAGAYVGSDIEPGFRLLPTTW